ncbi:MAG: hypothetical protein JXA42_20585 [Anaerolineales bacterium]|nr:hypothetical protein [Anaerolineales bacterium]
MAQPQLKLGKMENAPDWYGKSLDELDFEWSKEEELELERYCEKILKNAEEEEMTPKERYYATWEGKEKDRLHIETKYFVPVAVRTLDSFADAIKPGDLYKWPKLHVKGHLAFAARYKQDIINVSPICYTEELWGADGRMIDYGTPQMVGEPPIKTMEDIESVAVPDPYKHGLYPGFLWACREIKRVLKKYGADKVMPVEMAFCGDPLGNVFLAMLGFSEGIVVVKKNPELFRACMDKMKLWTMKFGRAIKALEPDGMYLCSFMGAFPPKMGKVDNSFIADINYEIAQDIIAAPGHTPYMWHTIGAPGFELWMRLYGERKAVGPGSFGGWYIGHEQPVEDVYGYAREKDLYCVVSINEKLSIDGDFDGVREWLKPRCEQAKLYPKHGIGLGPLDYWTPQPYIEKTMEIAKEMGRF